MSKVKIKIKSQVSNYSDGISAADIEKEAREMQEEAQLLPDCDGVYWDIATDYDGYASYSWVFYARKKKEEVTNRNYKLRQFIINFDNLKY